jgi:hypothetical protein
LELFNQGLKSLEVRKILPLPLENALRRTCHPSTIALKCFITGNNKISLIGAPCDELNIKFRKMYWLLGRNSELSVNNKLILYKQVICPVWSYGIQLWGCASDSNIQVIQRYQNKVPKCIVNAPWNVQNSDLHRDLRIETVTDIITNSVSSHEKRLQDHINIEASRLLNVNNTTR